MASLLGDLFTAFTGVTPDRAREFLLSKAKEALRERVCTCGHITKQHDGKCQGFVNGEPCKCPGFVSLASRDRANG